MSPAETKLALEAGTAGLTLVSQLISMVRQAKQKDEPEPGLAELMARLPAAAFSLSKNLVRECEALKKAFIEEQVDMKKTIAELESDHWWWFSGKYKLVQGFQSYAYALSNVSGHAIDDFIAVARCRDQIGIVAGAFEEARKLKEEIDSIVRRDVPVEAILDGLIGLARRLRDDAQKLT